MDEIGIPERDNDHRLAQFVAAQYDAPAYVRRALQVQEALDRLLTACRKQRDDWLKDVRAQLTGLAALVGGWSDLRPWVTGEDQLEPLGRLQELLGLQLLFRRTARVGWGVGGSLRGLCGSLRGFNRRWRHFVARQNLQPVNAQRDDYNRYFVLEKECALRSARLARHGFQPLPQLTVEDLLAAFPFLPVPQLQQQCLPQPV